jgi:ribonuclease HII
MRKKWLIGIDEAGRGALAGPVAVGAVLVPYDFDFSCFSACADSKVLSPKVRERVFKEVRKAKVRYAVALVPASTIDKRGITKAVALGIERILKKLAIDPEEVDVRLDGLLRAPAAYRFQRTIIKGDVTEPSISLASIMAKVTRDRRMVRLSQKYPAYALDIHKGYGTSAHRSALKREGLSSLHRRSFCTRI